LLGVPAIVTLALVAFPAQLPAEGQIASNTDHPQVTFTKDIAPILQRSCQKCHRPDSVAPMSLLTYEEVRPWARSIKYRTGRRNKPDAMPPWYIEKNVGIQQYKGDISLSDQEIAKIATWVDSGAPRGNPADMPPPLKFAGPNEWEIGTPDLIVSSPTISVNATSPDWWGPIGEALTGLTEDRYVSAVEMREVNDLEKRPGRQTIGGLYVIHHLIWSAVAPDTKDMSLDSAWPVHEVGRNADVFDPEAGRLLAANSKLVFPSAHLHSSGSPTKARVDYGFKFHPKGYAPKKRTRGLDITATLDLDIKGMQADQKIEAYSTLSEHSKIVVYEPHMHAAGVRMCLDAIWGTTVQTLSCSGYNHSWVRIYSYADDAAPLLPKGTILRVTGYFDNTPANKNVSDPRNWSGLGHRSIDNMLIDIGQRIVLSDEEFQQEMAERRKKLNLKEGQSVLGCPLCGYSKLPATTTGGQQP
jgi:mono/diheme cytochrome c family protein